MSNGKTQKDIAKLLGVTEPAISQYMSSKRAKLVKFNAKLTAAIAESAQRIAGETGLIRETQRLLRLIREERVVCQIHASLTSVPKNCTLCFED